MATWTEFATAAPAMSAAVAARLTAHKHHVLATLRKDGSPRVSGTEVVFTEDGLLRLDSMPNALKAVDLQRDPRFALHANPGHHTMDGGDAKLSGTAVELTDPDELQRIFDAAPPELTPFHVFDLDIAEVVLTTLVDNHIQIDLWRPGAQVQSFTR
ncbi:MAG: pyridoxamine 5'-phosphate oxidase family protein [Rhodococcus sp. (in: high G+C Gram-positive bacteria)]